MCVKCGARGSRHRKGREESALKLKITIIPNFLGIGELPQVNATERREDVSTLVSEKQGQRSLQASELLCLGEQGCQPAHQKEKVSQASWGLGQTTN